MTVKNNADVVTKSAVELTAMLAAKEISSVEMLGAFQQHVEKHSVEINAIVETDYETALQLAKNADQLRSQCEFNELPPLHGLPMTVKEAFDVKGMTTTWGLTSHKNNRASNNAEAVDRLVQNGAIIFGKTNVPAALSDCQTFNPLYGRTNNPWNTDTTCGGSSGGSAAALAARFTPLELGSDLGGSIRTPAHFCGVFSHKPSYGLVSQVGHSLIQTTKQPDLAVAGPMARNADDLCLLFSLLTGATSQDKPAWHLEMPASRLNKISDARIAVLPTHPRCEVEYNIAEAVETLADELQKKGAKVEFNVQWPVDLAQCFHDYVILVRAVSLHHTPKELLMPLIEEAAKLDANDYSYRAAVRRAAALSHRSWSEIDERRMQLRSKWQAFFQNYDLIICPVHSSRAFPHITDIPREDRTLLVNGKVQDYNDYLFWMAIAGLSYLPSTVLPIASSGGLPIGVQLIGPYLEDMTTLKFAKLLEEVVPPLF